MLRLRRVTFFIRDSMFVIAPLDQLLAQSLDVPKPLAIRSEPLNDTLVGGAIPVQDRVGSRLSSQPLTNPVEMVLLVPQQGAESPARRVGQTASGQFVREMTMNAVLEDVREREHFGDGSRRRARSADTSSIASRGYAVPTWLPSHSTIRRLSPVSRRIFWLIVTIAANSFFSAIGISLTTSRPMCRNDRAASWTFADSDGRR